MAAMLEGGNETPPSAGASSPEVDVAALIAQLEEEVRLGGPRHHASSRDAVARYHLRSRANRLSYVSAEGRIGGRGGLVGAAYRPVKLAVRKLVRWYVEPAFADQRDFNDVVLKLIDDLHERVERLEEAGLEGDRRTPDAP
jgi:hypothetical protein